MPPKVSVVIKSYNHAAFIGKTINSILEQSFQDFEIIVTDDCSTDGTPDIVRQFNDDRIKLEVLSRNHGISLAMNSAIARARGEYIAILNSDDYALPGRLAKQVAFLDSRPDVSVVVGLPLPVDEHDQPCKAYNDFDRPLSFPNFKASTWLNSFFFKGNCICAPTAMLRRNVYTEVGEYNPKFTNLQDFDVWIRILSAGYAIHLLPEKLTAFRIRDGFQNMSAPRTDSLLRHNFELVQILKHYTELDLTLLREVFANEIQPDKLNFPTHPELLVADIALSVKSASYNLLALQLIFDHAADLEEFHKLKELTGKVDIFNTKLLEELQACHNRISALENSTSWKITAPLRQVSRFFKFPR